MNAPSRRQVLWTFAAGSLALLTSGLPPVPRRAPSVSDVMRYLREEIFPSAHQRRDDLLSNI